MPAIKLKKVTAEYLAEKEKEEKLKADARKVSQDDAKKDKVAEQTDDSEDEKPHNFLDVEILSDKRKRSLPLPEQTLIEWLDSNLVKKDEVKLPHGVLYEYFSEVCQMQGHGVVDEPLFRKYVRDRFGKTFGFQENSPYKVLIKEKKLKSKPKVQGQTLQMKLSEVIREVINELGNPRKGIRFVTISKAIMQKYPAQRVDIYPDKLKYALERGVANGKVERTKGVGKCGYYRLFGEPTKEEPEEKEKKEKTEGDEEAANGATEDKESANDDKDAEKKEENGEEEGEGDKEEKDEEKKKKKKSKKKRKPVEKWARSNVEKHSNPERIEDILPLALTYQTDPKIASNGKIRDYIMKFYHENLSHEQLKNALEKGEKKGIWECVSGRPSSGSFHLLIDTFMPGRSDNIEDKIAQAIVACNEPKLASAQLVKKYISQYHPKFNIDNRLKTFKHALERACDKGLVKQLSGIGLTGRFQLVSPFIPSPAILAGDTSDSEEEVGGSESDDEGVEYVPRATKSRKLVHRPKPSSVEAPQHGSRSKPRQPALKKKSMEVKKRGPGKSPSHDKEESSSESEVDSETEYVPSPSKSRGGGGRVERVSSSPSKGSASKKRGKASSQKNTPSKKVMQKTKQKTPKSAAVVPSSESEPSDDDTPVVTPKEIKSRGKEVSQSPKSSAKSKETKKGRSTPKKSREETPLKRASGRNVGKRSYAEVDEEVESGPEDVVAEPSPKKKARSSRHK